MTTIPDTRTGTQIVLASSSPYRKQQLLTLGLNFVCAIPAIDESVLADESAITLATRLAAEKALAVAIQHPGAVIISADQTVAFGNRILGKPGTHDAAFHQLQMLRGNTATFHSAIAVLDTKTRHLQQQCIATEVTYRTLTDTEIMNYLQRDEPYDCAGSFKSESLGIAILASVQSSDPSALIGLPLIALTQMLAYAGVDVLAPPAPSR